MDGTSCRAHCRGSKLPPVICCHTAAIKGSCPFIPVACQIEVLSAGGSYTDVGICTSSASLHRGDYDALFGKDKHSWVLTCKGSFDHHGKSEKVPVKVESVRQLVRGTSGLLQVLPFACMPIFASW